MSDAQSVARFFVAVNTIVTYRNAAEAGAAFKLMTYEELELAIANLRWALDVARAVRTVRDTEAERHVRQWAS